MNALLSPLSAGATVEFLPDHRFDAAAVWQRWRESYPDGRCAQPDSITFFTGVPTHYVRLLQEFDRMPLQLQRRSALAASKLRLMMCGSASCPEELMRRWQQVTGQRLLERYGMTEFAMALTNPLLGEKKPQSVGVPLRGVKVKLADIAKARPGSSTSGGSAGSSAARGVLGHVPAPGAFSRSIGSGSGGGSSGSTSGGSSGGINSGSSTTSSGSWSGGWGELLVKSPGMFLRYWNKPKETAEAFDPEGWFRTGDIASVDSHGYWQIHGRESVDIIKTRGYKVSALEIESKLLEHPLVSEAVVLGVPDREQGEAVAAVVVLGSTLPHHQNHHRTNHQQQQQQYQQQHVDSAPGSSHGEVKNEGEEGTGVADSSETASGGHPMLTLDELRKWASTRVAGYKVPSRLRVVDKMPRNVMGKVNKKDLLRDLFPRLQQS
ncbi:hypothetical protein CLOM_g1791 [Closterium sp. NIES-68]|nr:hypothetical protein CLOM_g1791 [Closterium sp. NIES-68]GJP75162.1 hypothetical protein CLOP_g5645 [Closterium sp. NIES-67]